MRWWAPGIGGGALAGAVVGGEVPLAAKPRASSGA